MSDSSIRVEQVYPHAPGRVFRALTTPELHAKWWAAGDVQPNVGHRFDLDMGAWGKQSCEVLASELDRLFRIRFGAGGLDTVISFTLSPDGSGTRLTLVHEGFNLDTPMGQRARDGMGAGWPVVLGRLGTLLGNEPGV